MRNIIFIFTLVLSSLYLPINILASDSLNLKKDGKIRFAVYHLEEFDEIQYLDDNGKWIESAYEKIMGLCRSRSDDQKTKLDKRLVELADHLQDHFQVDTIEIISCFRSRSFNKSLKDSGRNVANESFHTKGSAMDIHIDEVPMAKVRDYLLSLKLGGVGYYGNLLMVHMDFGPVRQWTGGQFSERTNIGIFNKESPIEIRTDKLNYKKGQKVRLKFTHDLKADLILEHYFRGEWRRVKTLLPQFEIGTSDLPYYGKYRLRFVRETNWQNSNEFYIKKLL